MEFIPEGHSFLWEQWLLLAPLPSLHLPSIQVFYFLEDLSISLLHHLSPILSSLALALSCHFLQEAFLTLIPESGSGASITYGASSLRSTSHTMFFLPIYFSAPPSEVEASPEQVPSLPQARLQPVTCLDWGSVSICWVGWREEELGHMARMGLGQYRSSPWHNLSSTVSPW